MNHKQFLKILGTLLGAAVSSHQSIVFGQQIVPDNTLGNEHSVIFADGPDTDRIDGGAIRGINSFHSFQEFGIAQDRAAYFLNPVGIENIFGRVTGPNRSDILGRLGVLGNANLFLINPNGILFGPEASLDIPGSFTVSTANEIIFPDSSTFSALSPAGPPLLSVDVSTPVDIVFEGSGSGDIVSQGALQVGENLSLVANSLDLQGQLVAQRGNLTLQAVDSLVINDSVEQAFIARSGRDLLVEGGGSLAINALDHLNSGLWAGRDLTLRSDVPVIGDAHYRANGNFQIEQLDGELGDLESIDDPIILAAGDVRLASHNGASLHVLAGGSVELGTVTINGVGDATNTIGPNNPNPFLAGLASVILSDGTSLVIDGSAQPTLDVRAGINWQNLGGLPGNTIVPTLSDTPVFLPDTTNTSISINSITNNGGIVFLTNQYQPNNSLTGDMIIGVAGSANAGIDVSGVTTLFGFEPAGNVFLDSKGSTRINNVINASGAALLPDSPFFFNDGGNATLLSTGNINFVPQARVDTRGVTGGRIVLKSDATISFTGEASSSGPGFLGTTVNTGLISSNSDASLFSFINPGLPVLGPFITQQGAGILVEANALRLGNFTTISSGTFNQGDAGGIEINVADTLELESVSFVQASTLIPNAGNAADVTIRVGSLRVADAAGIQASTGSSGTAGDINIIATEEVIIGGFGNAKILLPIGTPGIINASSLSDGDAGNIVITSPSVTAVNGGSVSTLTIGNGNAGDVTINSDAVTFLGADSNEPSGVSAESCSSLVASLCSDFEGVAGSVFINTRTLDIVDGAGIRVSTLSNGDAGQVEINASDYVSIRGQGPGILGSTRRRRSGIAAVTLSSGDAGSVVVNTGNFELLDGGLVGVASVGLPPDGARGDAGSTIVNADSILIDGQGTSITAISNGEGAAGSVSFTAQDQVTIRNNAFILAGSSGAADGGDIAITADQLVVSERGELNVSNSIDGNGGTLVVNTRNISLDGQARLVAQTQAGQGGLIDFRNQGVILLRNNSLISAESISDLGNSGNINIGTGFIFSIPTENSDIVASAFKEGNVDITAQGIFGIAARERLTPFSDITATGIITLNLPNFDPTQNLTVLPTEPRETDVDNTCRVSNNTDAVQFYDVGKGGSPPRPDDLAEASLEFVEFLLNEEPSVSEAMGEPDDALTLSTEDLSHEPTGQPSSQLELANFVPLPVCAGTY